MTLEARIEDHRAMFREELDFTPSQQTPPVAFTYDKTERALVPDDRPFIIVDPDTGEWTEVPDSATQSTQVGMPMSSRMYRYLAGPAADTPWATALKRLRHHCRGQHKFHRGPDPYWRGSLCWQFVCFVVIGKPLGDGPATIQEAARILRYDDPEPIIREALDFIEQNIDDQRKAAEARAAEDRGLFLLCECGHDWRSHDRPAQRFSCGSCSCGRYYARLAA